jgi:hypothetical protein
MQYVKITNGNAERYTFRHLRKDNPNTSFPKEPSTETLAALGVFPVTQADQPTANEGQVVERDAQPTDQGDGTYVWGWTVKDKPGAQLAEEARDKRDALLSQSDWTMISDAPVDQTAWATYRQALRDVPAQAGFPENIDWPVAPE